MQVKTMLDFVIQLEYFNVEILTYFKIQLKMNDKLFSNNFWITKVSSPR